jgi:hypothetical protein
VWGLDFGLPYEFHPDEHKYVDQALDWHLTGQMETRYVNPPLFTHILVVGYRLWLWASPFVHAQSWLKTAHFFARYWSAAFGLFTVALMYPFGKRLGNCQTGLLAMTLLAGAFLPARDAHFAVNDTLMTFLVALSLYLSIRLLQRPHWFGYVLAGAVIGLSAAAKLTGGMAVLALVMSHAFIVHRQPLLTWKTHRLLLLGVLAALVAFLAVVPGLILNIGGLRGDISRHMEFGAGGYKGVQMAPWAGWVFYSGVLGWGLGWPMLAAAVGLGLIFIRRRAEILTAVFVLVFWVYMGSQKILFARFLLPVFPPLIVLAAVSMTRFTKSLPWSKRNRQMLLLPAGLLLLAQPLANLVWFDHLLTLPDTRTLATEWFTREFPEDTVVAWESYSILPQVQYLHDDWPYKRVYLDDAGASRQQVNHYLSHKAQVIVVSNYVYERRLLDPTDEALRGEQLANLEEKAELLAIFSPYYPEYRPKWFYLDEIYGPAAETLQRVRPGPLIKLYRLPYEHQPYSLEIPAITNPVEANFGNQMALLGYDLPQRRAEPGGTFSITLYWQAVSRMDYTFVIFNHLLDAGQRNWGGYDRWPRETANTRLWHPGEVVDDAFTLPVAGDAPPGIYTIDIGLYSQNDPAANPVPLVSNGQLLEKNSVRIGPVKVGGPPPGVTVPRAAPENVINAVLGEQIELLGFDLNSTFNPANLKFVFYWQAMAPPAADYTVFVHVRDASGQAVAQKDRPPVEGAYPTGLWDAGEIIKDELEVPLGPLPPGRYQVVTGLYNAATGQRLAVEGSVDGTISLQTVEINE